MMARRSKRFRSKPQQLRNYVDRCDESCSEMSDESCSYRQAQSHRLRSFPTGSRPRTKIVIGSGRNRSPERDPSFETRIYLSDMSRRSAYPADLCGSCPCDECDQQWYQCCCACCCDYCQRDLERMERMETSRTAREEIRRIEKDRDDWRERTRTLEDDRRTSKHIPEVRTVTTVDIDIARCNKELAEVDSIIHRLRQYRKLPGRRARLRFDTRDDVDELYSDST